MIDDGFFVLFCFCLLLEDDIGAKKSRESTGIFSWKPTSTPDGKTLMDGSPELPGQLCANFTAHSTIRTSKCILFSAIYLPFQFKSFRYPQ